MTDIQESASRFMPLHWLQALRGKSVLFTPDEARAVLEAANVTSGPKNRSDDA